VKLVVALAALGISCGGGPDDLPICPTDDCTPPTVTVVRWTLDSYPERLFQGDTCGDLAVKTMRVEVTNTADPAAFATKDIDCNQGQASFLDLVDGAYTVVLTPLDADGNVMVNAPVTGTTTAGTADQQSTVTINLPFESWLDGYTGTFLFRLSWAGASCEAAVPNVATQTLTLSVNGVVVTTAVTDMDQKLDGTDPKPCRRLDESFAQFAEGIVSGFATFTVVGKDAGDTIVFENTFDTFVGAAKNNPTIMFDVPVPPPPGP
jgi:hypothetical protein